VLPRKQRKLAGCWQNFAIYHIPYTVGTICQGTVHLQKSVFADPDPHLFGKLDQVTDLVPHQSGKLDQDPHQNENLDPYPDPNQILKGGSLRDLFWSIGGSKSEKY
jgi:hypothetical protein